MSKNRPHPSELKAGDVIASPWTANIRLLQVARVDETTLGKALGDKLNPEKNPDTPAWDVHGHPYFEGTPVETDSEPSHHFVFTGGSGMYERPILMKSVEQNLGAEL